MAFVTYKDGAYQTSRITGPTHNFLALEFSDSVFEEPDVAVIVLPSIGDLGREKNNAQEVKTTVLGELIVLNDKFDTDYQIRKMKIVEDDTPSMHEYRILTHTLVKHFHALKKA